jgi:hypothetical protein
MENTGMNEAERTQRLVDALYSMIELFDDIDGEWTLVAEEDDITSAVMMGLDVLNSDDDSEVE